MQAILKFIEGDPQPPVPAALLRTAGVKIFVIAIGDEVDETELEAVAGNPSQVIYTNFDTISEDVSIISKQICENV